MGNFWQLGWFGQTTLEKWLWEGEDEECPSPSKVLKSPIISREKKMLSKAKANELRAKARKRALDALKHGGAIDIDALPLPSPPSFHGVEAMLGGETVRLSNGLSLCWGLDYREAHDKAGLGEAALCDLFLMSLAKKAISVAIESPRARQDAKRLLRQWGMNRKGFLWSDLSVAWRWSPLVTNESASLWAEATRLTRFETLTERPSEGLKDAHSALKILASLGDFATIAIGYVRPDKCFESSGWKDIALLVIGWYPEKLTAKGALVCSKEVYRNGESGQGTMSRHSSGHFIEWSPWIGLPHKRTDTVRWAGYFGAERMGWLGWVERPQ